MNLKQISVLFLLSCVVTEAYLSGAKAASINEIRIDQPGADNDEFFELKGNANEALTDLSYIVIGDGSSALGSGVIESVTDLDAQFLDANGLFVAANPSFTLGVANLIGDLRFENSDNVTHMLSLIHI